MDHRPLSEDEADTLDAFLASSPDGMLFWEAHGFLTAVISAPSAITPSVWQAVVLGTPPFADLEHANQILGLLMRFYNQIVLDLTEGYAVAPNDPEDGEDDLSLWCAGYLEAAGMDDAWCNDADGRSMLFPISVLSGDFDLIGEEDDNGTIITDDAPEIAKWREKVNDVVHATYQYFTRRRLGTNEPVQVPTKIGRNERCACGSGLKFKKCCALKMTS